MNEKLQLTLNKCSHGSSFSLHTGYTLELILIELEKQFSKDLKQKNAPLFVEKKKQHSKTKMKR